MCGSWSCTAKPRHFLQHLAISSHSEFFRAQVAEVFSWITILALTSTKTKSKIHFCYVELQVTVPLLLTIPLKNTQYCVCFFYLLVVYNLSL